MYKFVTFKPFTNFPTTPEYFVHNQWSLSDNIIENTLIYMGVTANYRKCEKQNMSCI